MAIYYSILARRIPWTEQPGRLWSTGLQSQKRLKQLSMHAGTLINKNDKRNVILSSQFNLIDKIFPLGYLVSPAEFHFIWNFLLWLTNWEGLFEGQLVIWYTCIFNYHQNKIYLVVLIKKTKPLKFLDLFLLWSTSLICLKVHISINVFLLCTAELLEARSQF